MAGLAQAEGMWSVHLGDERWNVFTRLKGMSVFTQATRGGVCSRRWKGGAVFTQVEGMWSVHAGGRDVECSRRRREVECVHAGGRDVECGNFLLESTFNRMYEYTYARYKS